MPRSGSKKLRIDSTWQPTPEAINALPEPLRRYIHDLETNADPAGMVRDNIILQAQLGALNGKLTELDKRRLTPVAPRKGRQ